MATVAPPNYKIAVLASQIVFLILSLVAVTLRFMARRVDRRAPGASEYTILVALAMLLGICCSNIWGAQAGIVGVVPDILSPAQSTALFKLVFVTTLLNFIALGVVKISIALFYGTIFINATFKKVMRAYMGVAALWMVVAIVLELIAIQPIEGWWAPVPHVTLVNLQSFITIITAINIVLDVTLLCMPLFVIGQLKMSLKRKIQAGGIFGLGFFVCVGSALHLYFATQLDIGSASIGVAAGNFVTASLEVAGSIITACLPTFAPLFRGKGGLRNLFISPQTSQDASSGPHTPVSNETRSWLRQSAFDGLPPNWASQHRSSFTVKSGTPKEIEAQQCKPLGIVLEQTFGSRHHALEEGSETSDSPT